MRRRFVLAAAWLISNVLTVVLPVTEGVAIAAFLVVLTFVR